MLIAIPLSNRSFDPADTAASPRASEWRQCGSIWLWCEPSADAERGVVREWRGLLSLPVSISSDSSNPDGRVEVIVVGAPQSLEPGDDRQPHRTIAQTLLELYLRDGVSAISKLRGAFACVIADGRDGRVYLARDFFGFVPLFHYRRNDVLFCSTSLRALTEAARIEPRIEPAGLLRYYLFGYVAPPLTLYRAIRQTQPGHYCAISRSEATVHRYAQFPTGRRRERDEREIRRELTEAISQAVFEETSGDADVSIALSGGLDSAVVAAALPEARQRPIRAFTLRPRPRDPSDSRGDEALGEFCGEKNLDLTPLDFDLHDFALLPQFLEAMREPVCVRPLFYLFLLLRGASGLTRRMLLGEGGDELFVGYRHQIQLLQSFVRRQLENNGGGRLRRERLLRRAKLLEGALGWTPSDDVIEEALACLPEEPVGPDLNGFLDALVEQELTCFPYFFAGVRLGAFWGIDVRCPLLHPAVVNAAFSLSWESLVTPEAQSGLTKTALRNAFRGVIPDRLLARPKEGFGESWNEYTTLTRQFAGYSTATVRWLEASGLPINSRASEEAIPAEGEAADLFWHNVFLGLWLESGVGELELSTKEARG